MRIPGIVDVYQVGDQWVARSWPRPSNQPNSPAQLLWRQKFADAKAVIATFRGTYLDAWKAIECPPGKMWIDIAIRAFLMVPGGFHVNPIPPQWTPHFYKIDNPGPLQSWKYFLTYMPYDPMVAPIPYWPGGYHGANWKAVLKWNDNGWLCAKGKRPKKKWDLSIEADHFALCDFENVTRWPDTNAAFAFGDMPDGITLTRVHRNPGTATVQGYSVLLDPPMYFKPEVWTGGYF